MPIYEYKCDECGETQTALKPVFECKEPLLVPCLKEDYKPGSAIQCKLKRILSPTPTTFRFNDNTGYKGTIRKHRL